MNKIIKKKRFISLCLCVTLIITILCSCSYEDEPEKNIPCKFSSLSYDLIVLLQDNGLYYELIESDLYSTMFCTYHVLKTLKEIKWFDIYSGKDEIFSKVINKITFEKLIADGSYDTISNIYYYLKIREIAFSLPVQNINMADGKKYKDLVEIIYDLQSKDKGFFFPSKKYKEEYSKLNTDIDDPVIMRATLQAIEILSKDKNINIDLTALKNYATHYYENLQFENINFDNLSNIAAYGKLNTFIKAKDKSYNSKCDFKNIYEQYFKMLENSTYSNINIINIYDLFNLKKLTNTDYTNTEIQIYTDLIQSFLNNDYGYSIEKGQPSHILATAMAIEMLTEINNTSINCEMLVRYLYSFAAYDYTFKDPSFYYTSIQATYYADKILSIVNKYCENSEYIISLSTQNFIKNFILNEDFSKYSASDMFYLIDLAFSNNINIKKEKVFSFLTDQIDIIYKTSYQDNKFLILQLLETLNNVKYEIPTKLKKHLRDNIKLDYINSQTLLTSDKIVNSCIDMEILRNIGYFEVPEYKEYIDIILHEFLTAYNQLEEKIYSAYWVVLMMQNNNISAEALSSQAIESIFKEINKYSIGSYYTYSDKVSPTLESTYKIISMIIFLESSYKIEFLNS